MNITYVDFSPEAQARASRVVEHLLTTYRGTAIVAMEVRSAEPVFMSSGRLKPNSVYSYLLRFRGGWQTSLQRSYTPREWHWTQTCPDCDGGSRWAPMGVEGQNLLSCGGCGLALASPNAGIAHWVDWSLPAVFPFAELDRQLEENYYDPLTSTLEASELIVLVQKMLIGAEDTFFWSEPANLAVLGSGEFRDASHEEEV